MISRVCRQVRDHRLQMLPLGVQTCSHTSGSHNCGFCLCPMPLTLGIRHCLLPWRRVHKPGSPAWAEKCNSRGPVRSQSSKLQWSHVTHGEASPAGLEVPRERGSPFLHSISLQVCLVGRLQLSSPGLTACHRQWVPQQVIPDCTSSTGR